MLMPKEIEIRLIYVKNNGSYFYFISLLITASLFHLPRSIVFCTSPKHFLSLSGRDCILIITMVMPKAQSSKFKV